MRICVHGTKGKGGESEPRFFYLATRRLPVIAILARWSEAGHRYFEVRADDGRCFLLRHSPGADAWELAGVSRRPRRRITVGVVHRES